MLAILFLGLRGGREEKEEEEQVNLEIQIYRTCLRIKEQNLAQATTDRPRTFH